MFESPLQYPDLDAATPATHSLADDPSATVKRSGRGGLMGLLASTLATTAAPLLVQTPDVDAHGCPFDRTSAELQAPCEGFRTADWPQMGACPHDPWRLPMGDTGGAD